MPRYKRLKKVNRKGGKRGKKGAVKDDIAEKKKKEDIKEYELKKLLWELRGGKLRFGKAAGRVSGSSWIAVQNKSEELKNQRRNAELLAKQQMRENANVRDQYETYRTNVELEKGVGVQNEINSMKEANKAMEFKLQQQRKTSASGNELMNEISEEYTDVKKKSDLMSEIVKREQDIGKSKKKFEEDRKKFIELIGGEDNLPEVMDEDYVKEQQTAYADAKRTQLNVTKSLDAYKKAAAKYDKEGKRLGIPEDSDFYKTKDLLEKKSMMNEYLADRKKSLQKEEEGLADLKKGITNMKKAREDNEKSVAELRGQITELYPDDSENVEGIINDPRYTFDEKVDRIHEMQNREALKAAQEATLYEAAVMVGKHNKRDAERAAELNDLVGRLHEEAVNDKRLYAQRKIYEKGTAGFNREVKRIMQVVNPLYDSVSIEEQYRPENVNAVAVLESINKEVSKLRDEDESVE